MPEANTTGQRAFVHKISRYGNFDLNFDLMIISFALCVDNTFSSGRE